MKAAELLQKLLINRLDAFVWINSFRSLCHAIDDIIDIPERRADNEYIGSVFNKMVDLLSSDFYSRYRARLYPIIKHIHNTYYDSVKWENSLIEWQRVYSDVQRCCTNVMLETVVEMIVSEEAGLEAGYIAKREISLLAKEESWYNHHDETGKPI